MTWNSIGNAVSKAGSQNALGTFAWNRSGYHDCLIHGQGSWHPAVSSIRSRLHACGKGSVSNARMKNELSVGIQLAAGLGIQLNVVTFNTAIASCGASEAPGCTSAAAAHRNFATSTAWLSSGCVIWNCCFFCDFDSSLTGFLGWLQLPLLPRARGWRLALDVWESFPSEMTVDTITGTSLVSVCSHLARSRLQLSSIFINGCISCKP